MIPNRVIDYIGEPDASSFYYSDYCEDYCGGDYDNCDCSKYDYYDYHPKYGFQNEISGNSWQSHDGENFPHSLWFKFKASHVLTKISFSSSIYLEQAPKEFAVIASQDCINFQDLLHIEDAAFERQNQAQSWEIPEEKRAPYTCIGIKIHSSKGEDGDVILDDDGNAYQYIYEAEHATSVQNMVMWEKRF